MAEEARINGYILRFTSGKDLPKGLALMVGNLLKKMGMPTNVPYTFGHNVDKGTAATATRGIGDCRIERNGAVIRFVCQPGDNKTAREILFNVPTSAGYKAEQLLSRLTQAAKETNKDVAQEDTNGSHVKSPEPVRLPPTPTEAHAKEEAALQVELEKLKKRLAEANELLEPADIKLSHEQERRRGLLEQLKRLEQQVKTSERDCTASREERDAAHEMVVKAEKAIEGCQRRLTTVSEEKRRLILEENEANLKKSGATHADLRAIGEYYIARANEEAAAEATKKEA